MQMPSEMCKQRRRRRRRRVTVVRDSAAAASPSASARTMQQPTSSSSSSSKMNLLLAYRAIILIGLTTTITHHVVVDASSSSSSSADVVVQRPQGTIWNTPFSHTDWKSMLAINQTLRSDCVLNSDAFAMEQIRFYEIEHQHTTPIDPSHTTILNASAVRLTRQWDSPRSVSIKCKYDQASIALADVQVDRPPGEPAAFGCIGKAMSGVMCTLVVQPHVMALTASVQWSILNGMRKGDCEITTDFVGNTLTCNAMPKDMPKYERFRFHVTLTNFLGTWNNTYEFNRRTAVLADKPELDLLDISAENGTVRLHWNTPESMVPLHEGMQMNYSLKYRSEFDDNWTEQTFGYIEKEISRDSYRFVAVLEHLHPFARYNASLRATTQPNNSAWWSEPSNLTFVYNIIGTPSRSPTILSGAFYRSLSGTELYVYWIGLPRPDWNGPAVKYQLSAQTADPQHGVHCVMLNGVSGACRPIHATPAITDALKVQVHSVAANNSLLISATPSTLSIPRRIDTLPQPAGLTQTTYAASNTSAWTRTKEFRWLPPAQCPQPILNYTVIWCRDSDDCSDSLNATTVAAGAETQVSVRSNETLRFAVAANSAHSSSGLRWCDCHRYVNHSIDEPHQASAGGGEEEYHITHYARGVNIVLELEQRCLGLYESIHIAYCSLNDSCTILNTLNVPLPSDDKIAVEQLEPNALYRFRVSATERDSKATVRFGREFTHLTRNSAANELRLIVGVCVAIVGSCCALLWFSRYAVRKTRQMRDIDVQLPEALADIALEWPAWSGRNPEEDRDEMPTRQRTSTTECFHTEQSERLLEVIQTMVEPDDENETVQTAQIEPKCIAASSNYVPHDLSVQSNGYILYPAAKAAAAEQTHSRIMPMPIPKSAPQNGGYVLP